MVGLSLDRAVNVAINSIFRTGRRVMSCISLIIELFLARKFSTTYEWNLYVTISAIDKFLVISDPQW